MPAELSPERLDDLVLLRLSCGRNAKSPPTKSAVRAALKSLTGDEMRDAVDAAVERLAEQGLVTAKPLRVTTSGNKRAANAIGRDDLPANTKWETVRNRYLVAQALGIDADDAKVASRLSKSEHVVGEMLRRSHGTKARPFPTRSQAVDALIWRKLGVETDRPVTLGALRDLVLNELIGTSRASFTKRVDLAAGRSMGAPSRASATEIRDEVIVRWLGEQPVLGVSQRRGPAVKPDETSGPRPTAHEERPSALATFASNALAAARRVPREGRFGDHKVFIAAAYSALDDGAAGLDAFKQRLVEANQEGLVRLARADLVDLMPADQVRASETRHMNATFHFIDLTPRGSFR